MRQVVQVIEFLDLSVLHRTSPAALLQTFSSLAHVELNFNKSNGATGLIGHKGIPGQTGQLSVFILFSVSIFIRLKSNLIMYYSIATGPERASHLLA